MRKISALLIGLAISSSAFADNTKTITIVNGSTLYSAHVEYQICSFDDLSNSYNCDPSTKVEINSRVKGSNTLDINLPDTPEKPYYGVRILKAEELRFGKVVASATFTEGDCSTEHGALILNDYGTSRIFCEAGN